MSNDKPTLNELYLQQRDRAEKADADIAVLRHELDVLKRETEARASREYDRGWNDGHGKKLDAMLERGCAERYLAERDKEREGASALRAKLDGCEKAHEATHQRLHGVLADYDKATALRVQANLAQQVSDHVKWVGIVRDELVQAGYVGGDRTVLLASLRAALRHAGEAKATKEAHDVCLTTHADTESCLAAEDTIKALRLTVQAKDVMIDDLQRANKSLSGLLDARTAENTRLSGLNELRLKKLNSADGKLDITFEDPTGVLAVMGETLVNAAKGLGAAEYCSWSLQRPGTPDAWELIVQRINGKRPAEELGRLCNALAEMIGFAAPPSPDGSANLWSPEARQRLLDAVRGALCSPKNLTRLLSGCYGYLVALPESHRPGAGWLEPVEVALGLRVKP